MRTFITTVVFSLGTLAAAAPVQASWLSEAVRNSNVTVVVGPSYGPGYYAPPVYGPPCIAPRYVGPAYVVPVAPVYGPSFYEARPYPNYRRYDRHRHHHH